MSDTNMILMARMIKDAERFYEDGDDSVLWKNDCMSDTDITLMSLMIKDAERFYVDGDDKVLWKNYIGQDGLPTTSKEVNDEYLYNREKEDDEDDEYWRFFHDDIWGYESDYWGKTTGYFFYRNPHRFFVPTCFKVERHPDDDLFLEQHLEAQVPWIEHHSCHNHAIEYLIKVAVISIIWQGSKHEHAWEKLRDLSTRAANDNTLYTDGIKACAYLVHSLYTKDSLYKIARRHTLGTQLKELWDRIEVLHKNDCPTHEVCKLIVQLMMDKEKYSFVTEFNLAKMVDSYRSSKKYNMEVRIKDFQYPSIYEVDAPGKDESQIFNDISKVVMEMESPPTILKVDDYICSLKNLLREDSLVTIDLIEEAKKIVTDTKTFHSLDEFLCNEIEDSLYYPLYRVTNNTRLKMQPHLYCIADPFFEVYDIHSHRVSSEILDIVEVAELRRIALGSRFIGRSHLIWAFYERGFGLPPEVRNTIEVNSSDEDHPPYHIYMASIRLAKLLGEDQTQLQHFVFVVLHSKDIGFDGEKVVEMLRDFKRFREALETFEVERSRDAEKGITVVDQPDRIDDVTADYS